MINKNDKNLAKIIKIRVDLGWFQVIRPFFSVSKMSQLSSRPSIISESSRSGIETESPIVVMIRPSCLGLDESLNHVLTSKIN